MVFSWPTATKGMTSPSGSWWSGRYDVGEGAGPLFFGDGRFEPGRHRGIGDQGQHGFWGVVGPGPAVAGGEPVDRGRADHVGQHVGEQVGGHGLAVALRVVGGPGGGYDGGDLLADVVGGG